MKSCPQNSVVAPVTPSFWVFAPLFFLIILMGYTHFGAMGVLNNDNLNHMPLIKSPYLHRPLYNVTLNKGDFFAPVAPKWSYLEQYQTVIGGNFL